MLLITFSKAGHDDIVLTEDDLFDWDYEDSCFSSDTFELGGVNAKSLYLLIDNNDRRFSRGTFSNSRATLEVDGRIYGEFNVELPKRRDGVIEITAYNDMIKLDCEYPSDYVFPQVFWSVYAQCLFEAGLTEDLSFDNFELNALFDNGVISADYTDYIYANSCRQLISGMAEWNGGFAHFNSDNKLQVDVFSKEISHEFYSGQLMELDYSDETITFSKVKTSFKNKTYEKGDDSGYTLVIRNQYISYGLTDENFETYLTCIYDYYKGFTLTPMSLVLAEPDFDLKLGDRISVYDEEEDVTVVGNISKINITGNCTMTITCGGFRNVSSYNNFKPTSYSQTEQAKTEAEETINEAGGTGGDTIESAIIIQQKDISHLLHEYTIIKYIAGNKAVYGGPSSSIIVGGYVFVSSKVFATTDSPMYMGRAEFERAYYKSTAQSIAVWIRLNKYMINYTPPMKDMSLVLEGSVSGSTAANANTQGDSGYTFVYDSIVAPDGVADNLKEAFPYGYASATLYVVGYAYSSGTYGATRVTTLYIGFDSIEEFNAAVGLRYEPEYKDEVQETITVVPDSEITSGDEILQLAYAYTDSSVKAHEENVNTAIDAVYDSISQTNTNVSANAAQIELNTSAIDAINDPDNGILAQSMLYTDTKTSS